MHGVEQHGACLINYHADLPFGNPILIVSIDITVFGGLLKRIT